jgi:hypothetical protein
MSCSTHWVWRLRLRPPTSGLVGSPHVHSSSWTWSWSKSKLGGSSPRPTRKPKAEEKEKKKKLQLKKKRKPKAESSLAPLPRLPLPRLPLACCLPGGPRQLPVASGSPERRAEGSAGGAAEGEARSQCAASSVRQFSQQRARAARFRWRYSHSYVVRRDGGGELPPPSNPIQVDSASNALSSLFLFLSLSLSLSRSLALSLSLSLFPSARPLSRLGATRKQGQK